MKTYYIAIDSTEISMSAQTGRAAQAILTDNPNKCYVIKSFSAPNYEEAKSIFGRWNATSGKDLKIPAFSGWCPLYTR